jgi:segregation and condensation protein A
MSNSWQPSLDFESAQNAAEDGDALVVDVDGFEGPLHLLLALARNQKVDLLTISITKLADQYLAFVHEARRRRFSLAADYLVMAAWLTYLKSRLLLPKKERPVEEAGDPEDLAARLAFQLAKLDAMRSAIEALKAAPQLKRDVFVRGDPDAVKIHSVTRYDEDLYSLVRAYVQQRARDTARHYVPTSRVEAYPLEAARVRLKSLLPELEAWSPLQVVAPRPRGDVGPSRASFIASTLSAGLEMVREGQLEVRQLEAFAEVYLRARQGGLEAEASL